MVEDNWYSLLLSHIESLYLNHHLPSHDVGHHQRVWGYVKELLEEIDSKGIEVSNQLIEQAIVASFFHDTGLLLDNSERHGYKSRLICEQFFKENPKPAIQGLEEVLKAIEHHDDKTLKIKNDVENNVTSVDLLTLISTADDLDAFGLVGVYRYWEIYSLRGVPKSEIPQRVIINLTNRLENFKGYFSYLENFVIHQEKRYTKTLNFYSTLLTLGEKSLTTNSYEIEEIGRASCRERV